MESNNFIREITSKDLNLSKKTIKNLIKSRNIEQLKDLFSKAEFIFPFLIERISSDFVKLVEENDIKTIFEFSKYYSISFEDMIVNSFLKFACEDLTDKILELFEKGTNEQKTYCAKYFSKIQDPLALEFLYKESFSDNICLKTNCAKALANFKDEKILNEIMEKTKKTADVFEIVKNCEFISAFGSKKAINFISEISLNNPMKEIIISNLLDNNDFKTLKNSLNSEQLKNILNIVIEAIPEDVTLDSLYYWNIFELIKNIELDSYSSNILYVLKEKLKEYLQDDIYCFDLDKNIKNELNEMMKYLEKLEYKFNIEEELDLYKEKPHRYIITLEVIKIKKLEKYCNLILSLINDDKLNSEILALGIEVLKEFNKTDLIDKKIIEKIQDVNLKALIYNLI